MVRLVAVMLALALAGSGCAHNRGRSSGPHRNTAGALILLGIAAVGVAGIVYAAGKSSPCTDPFRCNGFPEPGPDGL